MERVAAKPDGLRLAARGARKAPDARLTGGPTTPPALALHRLVGNAAVARLARGAPGRVLQRLPIPGTNLDTEKSEKDAVRAALDAMKPAQLEAVLEVLWQDFTGPKPEPHTEEWVGVVGRLIYGTVFSEGERRRQHEENQDRNWVHPVILLNGVLIPCEPFFWSGRENDVQRHKFASDLQAALSHNDAEQAMLQHLRGHDVIGTIAGRLAALGKARKRQAHLIVTLIGSAGPCTQCQRSVREFVAELSKRLQVNVAAQEAFFFDGGELDVTLDFVYEQAPRQGMRRQEGTSTNYGWPEDTPKHHTLPAGRNPGPKETYHHHGMRLETPIRFGTARKKKEELTWV